MINEPIKNNVERKTWDDFRACGLLFYINTILHFMGWAIVIEVDTETKLVTNCYPARVKYRGWDEQSQTEEHEKVAKYLAETAPNFPEEIK
jgi:hypothetical protein